MIDRGANRLHESFATHKQGNSWVGFPSLWKLYGMILADGGNIPLVAESVKVHQDANPAETWDGLLEPRDLGFIKPSDFEVIAIPKDNPSGAAGWYETKMDDNAQLEKPLGCAAIVQP